MYQSLKVEINLKKYYFWQSLSQTTEPIIINTIYIHVVELDVLWVINVVGKINMGTPIYISRRDHTSKKKGHLAYGEFQITLTSILKINASNSYE